MEGFQNISVKEMGGGMVLLQCSSAGVLERMLKSKAEWLTYYFREVKPWSPNLVACKRVAWVQVRGVPLHAWGEGLFKSVAARIGTFLDFDDNTASGAKFYVARIKISTTNKGLIDTVVKISVQGILFDLWILEENRVCYGVQKFVKGVEDERSWVESSIFSDGVAAELGEDQEFSGDEERSVGFEVMATGLRPKKGEEDVSVVNLGKVDMNFQKSTNKEELLGDRGSAKGDGLGEKSVEGCSFVSDKAGEETMCVDGEQGGAITEFATTPLNNILAVDLYFGPGSSKTSNLGKGSSGPGGSDPIRVLQDVFEDVVLGQGEVGLEVDTTSKLLEDSPSHGILGGGVNKAVVLSSLSESDNSTNMEIQPAVKKNFNRSKFPQLGVPKFIQLGEALKEHRRRKKKEGSTSCSRGDSGSIEGSTNSTDSSNGPEEVGVSKEVEFDLEVVLPTPTVTVASGMRCLGRDEGDGISAHESVRLVCGENGDLVRENLVLLESQKKLGFTFNTSNEESLKRMIALEQRDRKLLVDLESRGVQ
jgi:hypothetical protein